LHHEIMNGFPLRKKCETYRDQEEDHIHHEQVLLDCYRLSPLVVDHLLHRFLKVEFYVRVPAFLHPVGVVEVVEPQV
jgi:hypothetical protein